MALTKIGKEGITGISNSANANAITIDSGENVALSGTLGVTGAITGTLATATQPNITSVGTLTGFRSTGIDDNADALAITIDASEHVGLKTTTPSDMYYNDLVVNSGDEGGITILDTSSGQSALAFGDGTSGNARYRGRVMYYHDVDSMIFGTAGDERMRINSSGNVGIGTTSPAAPLHIETGTTTDIIRFGTSGRWGFQRANSDSRYLSLSRAMNGSSSSVLAIDGDNGNVGIATTTPYATLHVDGPSTTAPSLTGGAAASTILQCEDFEFAFGLDNASPYSLYAQGRTANTGASSAKNISLQPIGGNVGIGTRSPSTRLHIRSSVASSIAGYRDGTTGLIVEGDGASYIQIIASKTNPMGILFDGGNTHNDTARGGLFYDIDYGMAFKTGGGFRWKMDEAGDLIPYSTSTGIVLGATSNVAANTLDDYEEGTWTPTLVSTGASFAYSVRNGYYTKIGRSVSFTCVIQLDGGGNSFTNNSVALNGWPFQSTTNAHSRFFIVGRYLNLDLGNGYTYAYAHLNGNSSSATLHESGDNVPTATIVSNDLSSSSGQLFLNGQYITDS